MRAASSSRLSLYQRERERGRDRDRQTHTQREREREREREFSRNYSISCATFAQLRHTNAEREGDRGVGGREIPEEISLFQGVCMGTCLVCVCVCVCVCVRARLQERDGGSERREGKGRVYACNTYDSHTRVCV